LVGYVRAVAIDTFKVAVEKGAVAEPRKDALNDFLNF
jgi:hypothetical protein